MNTEIKIGDLVWVLYHVGPYQWELKGPVQALVVEYQKASEISSGGWVCLVEDQTFLIERSFIFHREEAALKKKAEEDKYGSVWTYNPSSSTYGITRTKIKNTKRKSSHVNMKLKNKRIARKAAIQKTRTKGRRFK